MILINLIFFAITQFKRLKRKHCKYYCDVTLTFNPFCVFSFLDYLYYYYYLYSYFIKFAITLLDIFLLDHIWNNIFSACLNFFSCFLNLNIQSKHFLLFVLLFYIFANFSLTKKETYFGYQTCFNVL